MGATPVYRQGGANVCLRRLGMDLRALQRWDATRRVGKPRLEIPSLKELNRINCQNTVTETLRACAWTIKENGLLWRWKRFSGQVVLVVWEPQAKQFITLNQDLEHFALWLGAHFDICDNSGMQFGQPARSTAARISEALLADEVGLPWADWPLAVQFRKEGK
jgi:hypothetical protein